MFSIKIFDSLLKLYNELIFFYTVLNNGVSLSWNELLIDRDIDCQDHKEWT